MVDAAEGFVEFELLRPVAGEERYFVVTRWDTREHYEAWAAARPAGRHADDERRGMSVGAAGLRGGSARRLTGPPPPALPRFHTRSQQADGVPLGEAPRRPR